MPCRPPVMRFAAVLAALALLAAARAANDLSTIEGCETKFGASLDAAQAAQDPQGECAAFTALAKCLRAFLRPGMWLLMN